MNNSPLRGKIAYCRSNRPPTNDTTLCNNSALYIFRSLKKDPRTSRFFFVYDQRENRITYYYNVIYRWKQINRVVSEDDHFRTHKCCFHATAQRLKISLSCTPSPLLRRANFTVLIINSRFIHRRNLQRIRRCILR